MSTFVHAAATALVDLVLPASCAACSAPATLLCPPCADAARGCLGGAVVAAGQVECHVAGEYRAVLADLVRAHKDGGRRDLGPVLGDLLAVAVTGALAASAPARAVLTAGAGPVLLVPAPSSAASVRRRGDVPLHALARRAARGWGPTEVAVAPVMARSAGAGTQKSLDVTGRWQHAVTGTRVRPRSRAAVAGRPCLVVDDVVTTGATVAATAAALEQAGADVLGAAAICHTPLRREGRA